MTARILLILEKARGHRPRLQPDHCAQRYRQFPAPSFSLNSDRNPLDIVENQESTMKQAKLVMPAICGLLLAFATAAQSPERINLDAIEKIKSEAARQSQVMDIAQSLTNVYGPRLTNSPS